MAMSPGGAARQRAEIDITPVIDILPVLIGSQPRRLEPGRADDELRNPPGSPGRYRFCAVNFPLLESKVNV